MNSLSSDCPICKKTRTYKTKEGYTRGLTKPCKSCSNSLSQGGTGAKYTDDGVKCSRCKQVLPIENFYLKNKLPYSYCKVCHVTASSKYFQETEKFSRYGITKEDYEKMLETQDGKCGGCSLSMSKPYIDHCHTSGKVRGLLCQLCNSALGLVKDNTDTLKKLIIYLKGE